ncbi:glycosyltransferase family 2 protein [Sulfitobacter sp. S190]|uniref:glycosyltransferase family 2 protein n=1 Tax=Sulfitobacter sp. S190 TaxID=2867022 RepID=UPI0021A7BAA1|nr:glycosyltransferase family 2 protein [Sulfitobacter sp. S190]UWR22015.1 glycosyltransferase family 2 protein [Sulfitobacter sp. S190]
MKICALTMVYRDYWAIKQWYMHYKHHLGAQNLFIVVHGADPRIASLCPAANIIVIPRDDVSHFDATRNKMLNGFQDALSQIYDWVIRTDADEIIQIDPNRYKDFGALFHACEGNTVFALGLNVFEMATDAPLDDDANVFDHRRTAVFSGHYSKAFAVRNGAHLDLHGVSVPRRRIESYPYDLPCGVYLAHLKFANTDALVASNVHRKAIARGEGKGLPGEAWRTATKRARAQYAKAEAFPHIPWEAASAKAYAAQIAAPARITKHAIVRSQFIAFKFKTTLPDWFAALPAGAMAP